MATHGHDHRHVHLDEADWQAFAEQTELEGTLLIGFVTGTVARATERRGPDAPPVRRVLDIGSGPGVGTCELARLFPDAHVVAVDGSPAMLARAQQRAEEHGFGGRVTTRLADLPTGLEELEPVDLIWASMSVHHVGDEVALLRRLHDLLAPAGVIAIAEMAEPMRLLPDDLDVGAPGLSARLERAGTRWFEAMREGLTDSVASPELSTMLVSAGLGDVTSWIAHERFDPPLSDAARQVALGHLRRVRTQVGEVLDDQDLHALDVLTDEDDPRGVLHRPDVFVAASRQIAIARSGGVAR